MAEIWSITEGDNFEWKGTWTKVGEENHYEVFDCVQTYRGTTLKATIHLIRTPDGRFAARKLNVTDKNECTYWGDVDAGRATATYHTLQQAGVFRFQATLAR